jgi:pyruvate formate lyase activating enzyme
VRSGGGGPRRLARAALDSGAASLSFTYSEPTVFFEYARDTGEAGLELGLPSVWVTNGFMGARALEALAGHVRAMNVDLKGFTEGFYREVTKGRLGPVKETIARARGLGIWVEVTTLLIPTVNDGEADLEALASFLAGVDPGMPWHVSRFTPLRFQAHLRPTGAAELEKARDVGRRCGIRHVYLGNARGPSYADTFCPGCGETLVAREGFSVHGSLLGADGACPRCGEAIPGVWG